MTPNERTLKRRKQRKKRMSITHSLQSIQYLSPLGNAYPLNLVATQCNAQPVCPPVAKKGKPMYDCYDCEQPSHENRQLTYFQNRVDSIQYSKRDDLRKMFNLNDDLTPGTGQDLIDRISGGKFTLRTEDDMKNCYYGCGPLSYFKWKDPAAKADQSGYDKALIELSKLSHKTTDIVTVGDSTQILAAIDALEAFIPSNAPAV